MSLEDSIVKLTVAINKLNETLSKNKVNNTNNVDNDKYLTINEFCELLGIAKSTFYSMKDKDKLKIVRIGRRVMIPKLEANRWINNR